MKPIKSFLTIAIIFGVNSSIQSQQIQIVNMIPNAQSNETIQDSEPNLSVNPATPNQMVGTAFTSNPLGTTTPASAPIFFSLDGGLTWTLNSIVPSNISTGDITTKFGTTTNWLYAGILRRPAASTATQTTMDILRTGDVTSTTAMTVLSSRDDADQPYVKVATDIEGGDIGRDRVYVGYNDFRKTTNNQTASIDRTLNGGATTPTFTQSVLESRNNSLRDGAPVRTAIHSEGVIYSAFFSQTSLNSTTNVVTGDIVVVRDDNWGNGTTPFNDLLDPGDSNAGIRVATAITCPFAGNNLGQERIWQRMNIAVNPNNSNQVYLVYSDFPTGAAPYTLHVRRSDDGGQNWTADIRAVANATNPDLAINSLGEVAFSYQQLVTGNWQSTVETTTNNFVTVNTNVLNSFPDGTPARAFSPYLGDYAYLGAMPSGKDFIGTFSASNDPTPARFPTVQPTWQRNVNSTTNQLRNLANNANVNISIDPYFYRVSPVTIADDFYVRDWTINATSSDPGDEPSTERRFWTRSDVWNRRTDTPGAFNSNDQPVSQAVNPIASGTNFAYARVHRKAMGADANVSLLFLKSEFGTGSNYQLINGVSSFTSLPFTAADTQQTMSNGVQWNLIDPAAVSANHVCIAVEISGPNDPSGNPTLLGRAPGSANGTDLLVLADNNKAQRNLQVFTGTESPSESMNMYALVHNPSLYTRNIRVSLNPDDREIEGQKYKVIVLPEGENTITNNFVILEDMKPCENRWIKLAVSTIPPLGKAPISYQFVEQIDAMKVNGFEMAVKSGKLDQVGRENLNEHIFLFQRLKSQFGFSGVNQQIEESRKLLENGVSETNYSFFLSKLGKSSADLVSSFIASQTGDPFNINAIGNNFKNQLLTNDLNKSATAHGNFVRAVNAYLSYLDKLKGNNADILQTIRWFNSVVRQSKSFSNSSLADKTLDASNQFIDDYSKLKLFNKDYPEFVEKNLNLWRELVKTHLPNANFNSFFKNMEESLNSSKNLQKSNCEFVMELSKKAIF